MRVHCHNCDARYRLPDAKFAGKVVKFRCRKCETLVPVDGRSSTQGGPGEEPKPERDGVDGEVFATSEERQKPQPTRAPTPDAFDEKTSVDDVPAWHRDELPTEIVTPPPPPPEVDTPTNSKTAEAPRNEAQPNPRGATVPARVPPPRKKPAFVPRPRKIQLVRGKTGAAIRPLESKPVDAKAALPPPAIAPPVAPPPPREERVAVDDLLQLDDGMSDFSPSLDDPLLDPSVDLPAPPALLDAFPDHELNTESDPTGVISNISVRAESPRKKSAAMWLAVAAASTAAGVALALLVSSPQEQAKANVVDEVADQEPEPPRQPPAEEPAPSTDAPQHEEPPAESAPEPRSEPAPTASDVGKPPDQEPPSSTNDTSGKRQYTQAEVEAYKRWVDSQAQKKKEAESPFNRGAAVSALENAAARASSCKQSGGPVGKGRVEVTFQPSGRVTSARIIAGDFLGNSVGGCVARTFRTARVPEFAGSAVTVAKTFYVR